MRALTFMLFAASLAFLAGCGEQPPVSAPASPPADEAVGRWVLDPDSTREATEVSLIEGRRGELEGVEGEENERLREMIRGQSSRFAEGISRMGTRLELRADGTYLNREEEGSATGTWFRSGDRIRFVLDAGEEGSSSSRWEYEGFLKDGRLHVRPPAPLPVVVVLRRLLAGEEPGSSSLDPLDAEMVATDDPDELVLLLSGGSGGAGYWSARAADQKLAKMGARALPAIRNGLDSGNLYIRQQCTYRLGMLKAGAHAAVPRLIEMLAKDHHEVAWSAAVALGRIAPSEPEVVAVLITVSGQNDLNSRNDLRNSVGFRAS